MTYGRNYSKEPLDILIQIGTDQVNLLDKIDKKLFVVIKKLESSEMEQSAFPDLAESRQNVKRVLDERNTPSLEDYT